MDKIIDNQFNEEDLLFVENIHKKLLEEQGIVLLEHMDKKRSQKIQQIISMYDDVVVFGVGKGNENRTVIRYKPRLNGFIDIKKFFRDGNQAYDNKNYDECINNFLKLLHYGCPKSFVYAKLAICFFRKFDKKRALDYMIVTNYISQQEDGYFDFTELILKLKKDIKEENNNSSPTYIYSNIEEITINISNSKLNIIEACKEYGLNDEQIDILLLMYAEAFYSQGYYEKGDSFLKIVEKSKNKTINTNKFLEEIRKNKKFYINRANEKTKQLVLTLYSKKIK